MLFRQRLPHSFKVLLHLRWITIVNEFNLIIADHPHIIPELLELKLDILNLNSGVNILIENLVEEFLYHQGVSAGGATVESVVYDFTVLDFLKLVHFYCCLFEVSVTL